MGRREYMPETGQPESVKTTTLSTTRKTTTGYQNRFRVPAIPAIQKLIPGVPSIIYNHPKSRYRLKKISVKVMILKEGFGVI
jgi:hypothetical protein